MTVDGKRYTTTTVARSLGLAQEQPHDPGPQFWLAGALASYGLLLAVFTLARPLEEYAFLTITDVAGIVPPLLAGALALLAARRSVRQVRRAWQLIGAGCLSWGAGEIVWTVYEVGLRREAPFPSLADAGYLAMLPLMALGFVYLSSEERRIAMLRPTLEGAALVFAFAALLWLFILQPTYTGSDATVAEKVLSSAYPVGDLVLVYALASAVRRQWGFRDGAVLLLLLLGLLSLVIADVGFAYLTLQERYGAGSFINLGWPHGFLIIAYAAALSGGWGLTFAEEPDADSGATVWRRLVPLAPLPPSLLLIVLAVRNEPASTTAPLLIMTAFAAVAVLAHQAIQWGLVRELERSRRRLMVWIGDRGGPPVA
jgi:hypothetical protein